MQFEIDQATGHLSFSESQNNGTVIDNASSQLSYHLLDGRRRITKMNNLGSTSDKGEINDVHGTGWQWAASCQPDSDGIQLTYHIKTYENHPFILLQHTVSNVGHAPVFLDDICLFQVEPSAGGNVSLPYPKDGYHFFKVGWHGWAYTGWRNASNRDRISWMDGITSLSYSNPATPRLTRRGEFYSEGWGILEGSNSAIVVGFVSMCHQFGQVYACLRAGRADLMLTCQVDGIRLDPGETVNSDWGYLQFVNLPNASPEEDYLEAVSRQMLARVPSEAPPSMWTHWYQFYHDVDEDRFLHNLDQLTGKNDFYPCRVAELDDGYQSAWGDWTVTNNKFQHGLEWLAKEISSKGFNPGLWLAPFTVQISSRVAQEHPDWLVKDKNGKPARVGFLYNMFVYALDLTHPEVLEHLRVLAHRLTQDWGYSMLKIDFLNSAALPGLRHDPKMTRAEALRAGLEAIRQGAGQQTFLLGCGCPLGSAIGIVDAMRIGPDTAPRWQPFFHWLRWAGPLIKHNPSMPALRNAMRHTMLLSSLNRKWWWNDPDCLLVRDIDTDLTSAEVQSSVSLIGLSGGMLISSDDYKKVSPDRMRWLSLLVPNLGLAGNPGRHYGGELPSLYQVMVERGENTWQLVLLINWSDMPADCRLCFSELGYSETTSMHVFDFWDQKYQRVTEPELVFKQVPAHGCKLLRLCETGPIPQLVGDTLHIGQGLELNSMRIVDNAMEIETIDLGRRVAGNLWFKFDIAPKAAFCNGEIVNLDEKGHGLYAISVQFMRKAKIQINL
jgi:alpha-galactosidase